MLGRAIYKHEMQTFSSGNPSQSQIFQKAADWVGADPSNGYWQLRSPGDSATLNATA